MMTPGAVASTARSRFVTGGTGIGRRHRSADRAGREPCSRADLHVPRDSDVRAALAQTVESAGPLGLAFINAGVEQSQTTTADLTTRGVDPDYRYDLTWVLLCMKHEIPLMQAEGGAMVNTCSGAGVIDIAGQPDHAAAKRGVIGLTSRPRVRRRRGYRRGSWCLLAKALLRGETRCSEPSRCRSRRVAAAAMPAATGWGCTVHSSTRPPPEDVHPSPATAGGMPGRQEFAVCGPNSAATSTTMLAGKPPCRACSRTVSASFVSCTQ
jgi:short chain dehydrogenase